jgi:hypothetical protein
MGSLFDSGPSAGDIRRSEEKARVKEEARLRLQEQKLRRRESAETMQGAGIATPESVTLGTDIAGTETGLEQVESVAREDASNSGANADTGYTLPGGGKLPGSLDRESILKKLRTTGLSF